MPSTLTERIASRDDWIGSAAAACTTTSAPATSAPRVALDADVAAHLLDAALELAVVERRDVERAHGPAAVGEHAPGEMEAEEAGPTGDRDASSRPAELADQRASRPRRDGFARQAAAR